MCRVRSARPYIRVSVAPCHYLGIARTQGKLTRQLTRVPTRGNLNFDAKHTNDTYYLAVVLAAGSAVESLATAAKRAHVV